jgi:hypothetical protein
VRLVGAWEHLAHAIENLVLSLLMLGDWGTAGHELTEAADAGLAGHGYLACHQAWLAALRGDAGTAETLLAGLAALRASEDPQDRAVISVAEAFTAAARRDAERALRQASAAIAHLDALGIRHACVRWAWPLAVRAAHDLADAPAVGGLLARLGSYPPGHIPPMLRAERDLARARLAAGQDDGQDAARFAAAVDALRALSTPYHLAHGLLDHAQHLRLLGDAGGAGAAVSEARDIGHRLGCQPLLDRAAALTAAEPGVPA